MRQILKTMFVSSIISLCPAAVSAAEVDLRAAIAAATTAASINIDVPEGDVLVLKAGPDLLLHRRRLVITAPELRIEANVAIRQFDTSDVPAAVTDIGSQGNPVLLGSETVAEMAHAGVMAAKVGLALRGARELTPP